MLIYGLYTAKFKDKKDKKHTQTKYETHIKKHHISHYAEELQNLYTSDYTKQYIIDVINYGSSQLYFKPTEVMDAGFASREDAPKIACYILHLSGNTCKEGDQKDAQMYYSRMPW